MALPVGGGIGGLVLLLLFSALTGTNPLDMINSAASPARPNRDHGVGADDRPQAAVHVASCSRTRKTSGRASSAAAAATYEPPVLVLFTRGDAVGVRRRPVGDGAVLLPERSEGVSRPLVLPASSISGSARRATSRRPTSSPTKSGTTCRRSSASRQRVPAARQRGERARGERSSRCAWSCRPTATPASGATTPRSADLLEPGDAEEGSTRRGGDWRRPPAAAGAGTRRARVVHARLVRAARAVAAARPRERPDRQLRHVCEGADNQTRLRKRYSLLTPQ